MSSEEMQVDVVLSKPKRPRAVVDYASYDSDSSSSTRISATDRKQKRKVVYLQETPATYYHNRKKNEFACSVRDIASKLTEKDVIDLFKIANISFAAYEFLVPSQNQRADKPPEGYITVYEEQIIAGLRFPLHPLVKETCNHIKVSPCQLLPNTHRLIIGFILCAKFHGIPMDVDSMFSLFSVRPSGVVKKMFKFVPMKKFLNYSSRNPFQWEAEFFFLRPKGISWNFPTTWSKMFSKPSTDLRLRELAVNKGILKHNFNVDKQIRRELLVHGGIEPGIPSAKVTFRSLMHEAAVTKFELLPEDMPFARTTFGGLETHHRASLAAHTNPSTSRAYAASPVQLRDEQPVNHLSASSEDIMHLNDFRKKKRKQEGESGKARIKANFIVPIPSEAQHQYLRPDLRNLLQNIESTSVPKDHYKKIEKDAKSLSSELAFSKSRILELEQKLAASEAKRADSEHKSFLANEALIDLEKRHSILGSELAHVKSRIQELEQELAVSRAKRVDSGKKPNLTNEDKKFLEKTIEDIKSDSDKIVKHATEAVQILEQRIEESEKSRDTVARDAIDAFKSSPEFLHIVQGKVVIDYFDSTDECGKSSGSVVKKCSNQAFDLAYVPRDRYQQLEKDSQELTSILKSRVQELELELALSKAKRAKSENLVSYAVEAVKTFEKSAENLKSDTDKMINDAIEASSEMQSRMKHYL